MAIKLLKSYKACTFFCCKHKKAIKKYEKIYNSCTNIVKLCKKCIQTNFLISVLSKPLTSKFSFFSNPPFSLLFAGFWRLLFYTHPLSFFSLKRILAFILIFEYAWVIYSYCNCSTCRNNNKTGIKIEQIQNKTAL